MYQKQKFKDGARLKAAHLKTIEDGLSEVCGCFFSGLSDALNNANVLDTLDGAAVMRTISGDQIILTLLQDVEENDQLNIDTNLVLKLNGHRISMSSAGDNITVAEGVTLRVDGTMDGSTISVLQNELTRAFMVHGALIVNGGHYEVESNANDTCFVGSASCTQLKVSGATISGTSSAGRFVAIQNQGANTIIKKVSVYTKSFDQAIGMLCCGIVKMADVIIHAEADGNVYGLNFVSPCDVTIDNCKITAICYAEKDDNKAAYGMVNNGTCVVTSSVFLADAQNAHADVAFGIGIVNNSEMTCINSEIIGTHSGIQNDKTLYVNRCLLSGVSHGGLYTTNTHGTEVIVNDTVLEVGVYRGQFAESFAGLLDNNTDPGMSALSAMYVGTQGPLNYDGGTVYMDGCLFVGLGNESFTIRPAAYNAGALIPGMNPNRVYLSRSKIAVQFANKPKGTLAPVRLNYDNSGPLNEAFSELYVGTGCNITADNLMGGAACEQYMHNTGMLYRLKDQHLPTYIEYMVQMDQGQGGDNANLAEVSAALDEIIALQEELIGV